MDFNQLKDIVSIKSFNIIQNLINKPKLKIYKTNYQSVDSAIGSVYDPYENTQVEINKITNNHKTLVKEVDCIYTYDKQLLTEDNNTLGSVYSLIIYMRADDVPKDILKEKNAIIIELNGIDFIVKSFQPSYDIIIQADLRR